MTNLVYKVILNSPDKHLVIRKIMDSIINTPTSALESNRGTPNVDLKKLLENIVQRDFEIDE
jgi:trehalose utilization protein